jgi:hypothetical protein
MQAKRHQHDEAVILGQRILSIEHKLESILQHLRRPSNLLNGSNGDMEEDHCSDDDSTMEPVTPTKSCSPSFLSSPAVATFSAPPDWFKLSFDPAKNSMGFFVSRPLPRK